MAEDPARKKEALQRLLEQGTVQLVLDPRREEVGVPIGLAIAPLLRLNVSQRFQDSDLRVDWWGVRQTLTFPEGRFACRIPWGRSSPWPIPAIRSRWPSSASRCRRSCRT